MAKPVLLSTDAVSAQCSIIVYQITVLTIFLYVPREFSLSSFCSFCCVLSFEEQADEPHRQLSVIVDCTLAVRVYVDCGLGQLPT